MTRCHGVNDKWAVSIFFEKYLEPFRRDVLWRERQGWHKVWLCGAHGPESRTCRSAWLSGSPAVLTLLAQRDNGLSSLNLTTFGVSCGDLFVNMLWQQEMVGHKHRCEIWCRIDLSMVEFIACRCNHWWNERLLVSLYVVTNCHVLLYLLFIKPGWEIETVITTNLLFCVTFFYCYTIILDRSSPSYRSMAVEVIHRIRCDICRNLIWTISRFQERTNRHNTHKLWIYNLQFDSIECL